MTAVLVKRGNLGNSLVVQRLGLCTLTAEGPGSVLVQGTRLLLAARHGQKEQNKTKQKKSEDRGAHTQGTYHVKVGVTPPQAKELQKPGEKAGADPSQAPSEGTRPC